MRMIEFNPGVADFLRQLGVQEEVINFIDSLGDPKVQGKLANECRKDPRCTLEMIKQVASNIRTKKFEPIETELQVAEVVERRHGKDFAKWMLVQLMKMRRRFGDKVLHALGGDGVPPEEMADLTRSHDRQHLVGLTDQVIDWVSATHPDMASFDWWKAYAATEKWHQALQNREGKFFLPTDPKLVLERFDDGWTIQQIVDRNDFLVEGDKMANCIKHVDTPRFPYDNFKNGLSIILSLRDEFNHPHVSLEIGTDGVVRQIKGFQNSTEKAKPYASHLDPFFQKHPEFHVKVHFNERAVVTAAEEAFKPVSSVPQFIHAMENILVNPQYEAVAYAHHDTADTSGFAINQHVEIAPEEVAAILTGASNAIIKRGAKLTGKPITKSQSNELRRVADLAIKKVGHAMRNWKAWGEGVDATTENKAKVFLRQSIGQVWDKTRAKIIHQFDLSKKELGASNLSVACVDPQIRKAVEMWMDEIECTRIPWVFNLLVAQGLGLVDPPKSCVPEWIIKLLAAAPEDVKGELFNAYRKNNAVTIDEMEAILAAAERRREK